MSAAKERARLADDTEDFIRRASGKQVSLPPAELDLAPGALRSVTSAPQPQRKNKDLMRKLRKDLVVAPADPDQALGALLNSRQVDARRETSLDIVGLAIGIPAAVVFASSALVSVISALALGFHVTDLAQFQQVMGGAGPTAGITALLTGNVVRISIKCDRSDDMLYKLAAARFGSWLWLRHKIKLDAEALNRKEFFDALVDGKSPRRSLSFTAEDGKEYLLAQNEDATFHIEQPVQPKKSAPLVEAKELAAPARLIEPAVHFSGEASVLFAEVQELLAKLVKRDLSVEDAHVLARAREDLIQIVNLNDSLQELDELDAQEETRFKEILLALRSELRSVVDHQKAQLVKDVAIAADYVKTRRGSTSRLALDPDDGFDPF